MRILSLADRLLDEAQQLLLTVGGGHRASQSLDEMLATPSPSHLQRQGEVNRLEGRDRSADLLRVDHGGEVAAQALYRGQALTTAKPELRAQLLQAAEEEIDHLVWCEQRLAELDDGASLLGPLWYLGSFALGATAGALAPQHALGFVEETELQVVRHLEDHLQRLPKDDWRSAALLDRMRADELRHAHWAHEAQAKRPRAFAAMAMSLCSKLMTRTSCHI